MKPGVSVRVEAARSLDRIVRSGAYSNVVVHQTNLAGPDRSAHQSLVYTALRWLLPVDARISAAAARPIERLQPLVLSVLRIAATEALILGREPHGVVDSAVESIGELGLGRAKGLVNAVSRAIVNSDEPKPETRDAFPNWMVDRVSEAHEDGMDLLASLNDAAPIGVRLRDDDIDGITPMPGIRGAGYVTGPVEVGDLEEEGRIDIIDPASTAVVRAMAVEPGMVVADLAAAPGGKTRAIADELVTARNAVDGFVVASDIHRTRVRSAAKRTKDFDAITWIRADAASPPLRPRSFDRVLLDAPCTGLGSLRRRPEIKFRIDQAAPLGYGRTQRDMLEHALDLVRSGGRLVYSVCTLFSEETSAVVTGLGGCPPQIPGGRIVGDGVLLSPLDTGTDGMFVSVFNR